MEAIGGDLREMQRIPLGPTHVAALREACAVVQYETGALLARPGQPIDRFTYVEAGEIEVVNAFTGERTPPIPPIPRASAIIRPRSIETNDITASSLDERGNRPLAAAKRRAMTPKPTSWTPTRIAMVATRKVWSSSPNWRPSIRGPGSKASV